MPVTLSVLDDYLGTLLQPARFTDYCPNGLQVEGRRLIHRIVTGVTASQALIDAAVRADADAIIVHHGCFWRGDDPCLTGTRGRRIAQLMRHGINLFAYHLPLDAHPALGNNAQLGARLGLVPTGRCGDQDLVWLGDTVAKFTLSTLCLHVGRRLGRVPFAVGDPRRRVQRIAWCSGAAQGQFEAAAARGIDAYLTGEISEQHSHIAAETGVAFVAAGHHATERYGVQAVGRHLADALGLVHEHIDIPNHV